MSADDQVFLDVLSSLPNEIRRYSAEVADFIDEHVDRVADIVRETLAASQWIPEYARPRPRPPPVVPVAHVVPATMLEKVQGWLWRHKILVGATALALGLITYRSYRNSRLRRRTRKARRAKSGGRIEVVVIAAAPSLPLTKSLALDMEQKGFIVFVVCGGVEEENMVYNLNRPDIKPLLVDMTDPASARESIELFSQYLRTPHAAVPRTRPYRLNLTGLLLIPSLDYEMSPIATIPPSHFADLSNSHLLRPIQTIQVFLPLLTTMTASPPPAPPSSPSTGTSGSTTAGGSPSEKRGSADAPKVVVFTPSLAASTSPPFHAPEATVCSALSAFTEVLAAELRPLSIPVVHVQLGGIGATGVDASTSAYTAAGGDHPRREMTAMATWTQQERAAYGGNFRRAALAVAGSRPHPLLWPFTTSSTSSASASASASASLRDLHRAVFDALRSEPQVTSAAAPTLSVVHVGLGAGFYSTVGRWMPPSLIGWFLGGADRRVDLTAVARATGDLERGLVVVPPGGRSRRAGGGGASGSEGLSDISPSPYPTPGSVSGDDEDEEEKAARRLRDVLDSVPDDGERWATQ